MSKIWNKAFDKIIIFIIIVLVAVSFREMIATDAAVSEFFGELIGMLPFADELAKPISEILKCQYAVPVISSNSLLTSFMILIVMACIQPLAMTLLSRIFLPIPSYYKHYYEMDEYMNSAGYRVKELLLQIIASPFLAMAAAMLANYLISFIMNKLGSSGGILASLCIIITGLGLSIIPLVVTGGMKTGYALLWRLFVTLLPKLLEIFVTNTLCIAVYFAVAGGIQSQIFITVGGLILWLSICFFGIKLIMRSIAGVNLSR